MNNCRTENGRWDNLTKQIVKRITTWTWYCV